MVLPGSLAAALALLIFSILCFGLWPYIFKFTGSKWRFELYSMDFGVGAVFVAVIAAYTLGTRGSDLGFSDSMLVAGTRAQAVSAIAGMAFALGNMCFLATIALIGLPNATLIAFCLFGCGLGIWHLGPGHYAGSASGLALLAAGAAVAIFATTARRAVVPAISEPAKVKANPIRTTRPGKSGRSGEAVTASTKGVITGVLAGLAFFGIVPLVEMAEPAQMGVGAYGGVLLATLGLLVTPMFLNFFFLNIALEGGKIGYGTYVAGAWKDHVPGAVGGAVWAAGALAYYAACTGSVPLPRYEAWLAPFGGALLAIILGLTLWQKVPLSADSKRMTLVATALFAIGVAALLAGS